MPATVAAASVSSSHASPSTAANSGWVAKPALLMLAPTRSTPANEPSQAYAPSAPVSANSPTTRGESPAMPAGPRSVRSASQ
jgi:hypothetical protein